MTNKKPVLNNAGLMKKKDQLKMQKGGKHGEQDGETDWCKRCIGDEWHNSTYIRKEENAQEYTTELVGCFDELTCHFDSWVNI